MLNGWTERLAFIAPLAALLATSACCLQDISGYQRNDAGDAGSDGGGDAGPDAGDAGAVDAGLDAGTDGGLDAGWDGGADAGLGGGTDAGLDAGVGAPDAGFGACGPGSDLTSYSTWAPIPYPTVVVSADMDRDGLLDLVGDFVDDAGQGHLFVALAQADGGLGAPQDYLTDELSAFGVGDLNGDGRPDVVTASWPNGGSALISVYSNEGNGALSLGQTLALAGQPFDYPIVANIAIGDVDGDGLGDIVLVEDESSDILYGSDGGQFNGPFTLPVDFSYLRGIAVGDLNGDGKADIIGNDNFQELVVLLSQGRNDFKMMTYPTPALGQIRLIPGPNGEPDLVLGEAGYNGEFFTEIGVAVMTNAGDGTFAAARMYTVPGGEELAIGDFNGDCIPDIATTFAPGCQIGWPIAVLFGDGDGGFFGPEVIVAPDPGPASLSVWGPVAHPNALVTADLCEEGVTIYGAGETSAGQMTPSIPVAVPLTPLFLLDAGSDTVFGPVSIAAVPDPVSAGVAKLVFAMGDGGNYGIMLATLGTGAALVGKPVTLAVASVAVPPVVTVADDGQQTAVCWEDWGQNTNPYPDGTGSVDQGPWNLVRCGAASEAAEVLDAGYVNYGWTPALVFNPKDWVVQLFFSGSSPGEEEGEEEWAFGQSPKVSQLVNQKYDLGIPVAIGYGVDGVVDVRPGLALTETPYAYAGEGYLNLEIETWSIDPGYHWNVSQQVPFAAAGSVTAQAVAVLGNFVLDNFEGLEEITVQVSADGGITSGPPSAIPSAEPPVGAVAVGVCSSGFEFFATTVDGAVLIARGNFDGGVVADAGQFLDLVDFNQTPGVFRVDNGRGVASATSMAVASTPDGNLLLAISNPAQVAVYAVSCE